jgi:hypothetical protein
LREHHTAILRTDLDGLITIRTDGKRITVETNAGFFGKYDEASGNGTHRDQSWTQAMTQGR